MRYSERHALEYIYWKKESDKIYLTINEFKLKLKELQEKGHKVEHKTKTDEYYHIPSYFEGEVCSGWKTLFCRERNGLHRYICNIFKDELNIAAKEGKPVTQGLRAKQMWSGLFKKYNDCTEKTAFGYCDRKLIHRCIPKSVYYVNKDYISTKDNIQILEHTSKVDYNSNYPSNALGLLPDWHKQKTVKGTVKPDDEYPFAYYINSGHIAEYGVFDSHEWTKHGEFGTYLLRYPTSKDPIGFDDKVLPEDDITILCKASLYNFDRVVR